MKKKLVALLAGALLTSAMAGNALAYFTGDDLIRVVYSATTGVEVATDLGSIATLLTSAPGTILGGGAASFTNYGVTGDLSTYSVAYFAKSTSENGVTGKYIWASGDATTPSVSGTSQWNGTNGAMTNMLSQEGAAGSTQTVSVGTGATNSYYHKADGSGTITGALSGIISANSRVNTEASLANIANTPVTQGLWYFGAANGSQTGLLALTLQTNADGSTTLNPNSTAATPIPPSFFLMGSGLLGMVGLRRKKRA
jgi:hypothetical protein